MTRFEIEQLKNDLALKVGLLELKINRGLVRDDVAVEIVSSYKEYEKKGTTIEEMKLLYDDVVLHLS